MSTTPSLPVALLRGMRPHQWTKNALVLAAPLAAGALREPGVLRDTLLAFVAFCAVSSATYLVNDIRDVASDRRHPTKRHRPIAAGHLPVATAAGAAGVLLLGGLGLAAAVRPALALTLAAYLALTTAYSLWLKQIPVIDLAAVAAGFVLRAVAGAVAADVPISEWFFIVTSFGALLMVTGKREGERHDLGEQAAAVRPTLGAYSASYLVFLRAVATGVVLIGYCLWAFETAQRPDLSDAAVFAFRLSIAPFVLAVLRYALLLDQGRGAEPERLVLRDPTLLVLGALWGAVYGYGVLIA